MEEARRKQFADRDHMLTQQAKAERDDFLRVVQRQKEDEANERKLEAEKKEALLRHKQTLQQQMQKNAGVKMQGRLDFLEEGKRQRQALEEQRQKILRIKSAKVGELGALGVADKYQVELQNKKVSF